MFMMALDGMVAFRLTTLLTIGVWMTPCPALQLVSPSALALTRAAVQNRLSFDPP